MESPIMISLFSRSEWSGSGYVTARESRNTVTASRRTRRAYEGWPPPRKARRVLDREIRRPVPLLWVAEVWAGAGQGAQRTSPAMF